MYHAVAVGNRIEVCIGGPEEEIDLDAFKAAIHPRDRRYDPDRKLWIVSSPERYSGCIIYIAQALEQLIP